MGTQEFFSLGREEKIKSMGGKVEQGKEREAAWRQRERGGDCRCYCIGNSGVGNEAKNSF